MHEIILKIQKIVEKVGISVKYLRGRMDESILVCVYYGPNGERLIRRGHEIAQMLDCPLYVLTIDRLPLDEIDSTKRDSIEHWQKLCDELEVEEFIIKDDEDRPIQRVVAEVCHDLNITQAIIGQTAQSRWEEITKGSFVNLLLRALPFVDLHVVSVEREVVNSNDAMFEKGARAYLVNEDDRYKVTFVCKKNVICEGIFFKEIGTDFENGIFKFMYKGALHEVPIDEGAVDELDAKKLPEFESA